MSKDDVTFTDEYRQGVAAFEAGCDSTSCPYPSTRDRVSRGVEGTSEK